MTLYDISVPLAPSLPAFPGDPPVRLSPLPTPEGGGFRVTRLSCGSHSGTHVDAPAHLLPEGTTVDELPLSLLLGPCLVVDLSDHEGEIGADTLKKLRLKGQERLLLRTRNSALWDRPEFVEDYVALTTEGAAYLVGIGVQLVGIDYLSVEPLPCGGATHRTLLEAGVVILEGLNLSGIERGEYELLCLPLKIAGGDGAPCRAVLRGIEAPEERPEHHTRWPP